MQFYVADYLADTAHLDTEEHGAYFLLLLNYWHTEKPVPVDRLQRICKINSDERWASVERTLKEFFTEDAESWVHERVECDLEKVYAKSKQASKAGKKSAKVRRAKAIENTDKKNARSTSADVPLNHKDKDKDKYKDKTSSKSDDGRFSLFWSSCPKKVDKKKAEVAFNRLSKTKQESAINDISKRYVTTEKQYIPNPTTYLHGERWNDEIIIEKKKTSYPTRNDCNAWVKFASGHNIKTKIGETQFDFERRVRNTIENDLNT